MQLNNFCYSNFKRKGQISVIININKLKMNDKNQNDRYLCINVRLFCTYKY